MAFGPPKQKTYDEPTLYEYAIGALGRRMRTVAELKRLLRRRVEKDEHGELLVETVIAHLKEQKYLNDTQYAATYTSLRKENNSFGKRRIISELKQRGVHDDIIDKTVTTAYSDSNEEQLARDFLRRKHLAKPADKKQTARIFRQLVRAGFASRTIMAILKKWDVEEELLSALEGEEQDQ